MRESRAPPGTLPISGFGAASIKAARRKSHAPSWTAPRSYTSHGCRAEVSRKDAKITAKNAKRKSMNENSIARDIVDAAYRVHTLWWPGLLEFVYEVILA